MTKKAFINNNVEYLITKSTCFTVENCQIFAKKVKFRVKMKDREFV